MVKIAHRGASGIAPENTLAAFDRALTLGIDCVEFDVRSSADGQAVVMHDVTLDRTTNLTGKVNSTNFDRITKTSAGSWFNSQFSDERVPTLEASLKLITSSAMALIELKEHSILEEVLRTVRLTETAEKVLIASFQPMALAKVKKLEPQIPTALIVSEKVDRQNASRVAINAVRSACEIGANLIDAKNEMIDENFSREVRRRGMTLWAWTVDDIARMRELIDFGVQGITSNFPDRFAQLA